jgi:hypothetical protein
MLGDSDFASGIFFADFGVPVAFGPQATQALLDTPGSSEQFGSTRVEKGAALIRIYSLSLNPMPKPKVDTLTVDGLSYLVHEIYPVDDGKFTEIKLKGPQ